MKTKDGRAAYGTGRECECGNKVTVRYCGAWICDRCQRIQQKIFKDKNYCGEYSEETKERIKVANALGGSSTSDKKRAASAKNCATALKVRWGRKDEKVVDEMGCLQ